MIAHFQVENQVAFAGGENAKSPDDIHVLIASVGQSLDGVQFKRRPGIAASLPTPFANVQRGFPGQKPSDDFRDATIRQMRSAGVTEATVEIAAHFLRFSFFYRSEMPNRFFIRPEIGKNRSMIFQKTS